MSGRVAVLGAGIGTLVLSMAGACARADESTGPAGGAGGTTTTTSTSSTTSSTTTSTTTPSGGAGGSGGGAGGLGGSGGAGGAGGAASCKPVSVGAFQLVDTEAGGSSLAYSLAGLDAAHEHVLFIEFFDVAGAQATGTFDLSQAPDTNYKTCAHCLLAYENFELATPTAYFPVSGQMQVTTADTAYTGVSAGTLVNVKLIEVTVESSQTTPVPGGGCLLLNGTWSH
jgi:hypothetical protein